VKQFGYRETSAEIDLVDTLQAYVTLELQPDNGTVLPDLHQEFPRSLLLILQFLKKPAPSSKEDKPL